MSLNALRAGTILFWLAVPVSVASPTAKKQNVAAPPTAQPSELDRLPLLGPQIVLARQVVVDRRKEMRLALAQFGGNCAAAIHHIQWLTWKPAQNLSLTTADFDTYDNAMHLLFPQLIGSFLTASAQNPTLFGKLKAVHDEIIDTDSEIGRLIAEARRTNNEDRVKLTEFHNAVNKFWDKLPVDFQDFMK